MIAANWVCPAARDADGAFDSDDNALTLYWAGQKEELPLAPKDKLARQLITSMVQRYEQWRVDPASISAKIVTLHGSK